MRKKILGYTAVTLLTVLWISLAYVIGGCSLLKTAQSAPVNQTITTAIAEAGTVANQAEQMYTTGQIPQTAAIRTAINDLGNAYNDARAAYGTVLTAEITYQASVNTQLTACAPAASAATGAPTTISPNSCANATTHATAEKVFLDNASATLNGKLSVLTAKVSAVKTYTTPK
jgi:hypothetical protein